MTDRRSIREIVLQGLYASDLGGAKAKHVLDTVIYDKLDGTDDGVKFAESLFLKTVRYSSDFDEVIERHIKNWRMERLATIDKMILRMAICEFIHFEEIPTKVTINEAIEIAKKYSTQKSDKFVNGILDAALNSLQDEGRIQKSGRGLIGSSE